MELYSGHLWTHQTSALIRNVLFPGLLYIVCLGCLKYRGILNSGIWFQLGESPGFVINF